MSKINFSELNNEQREAVTHKGKPLLVLAGAGSGKTRVLTSRAAFFIEEGTKPEEIVLLTFTNKAASEMKRRVEELTGGKKLGFAGTFHTFCARILRIYGSEIGISREYVIYDTKDQEAAMKSVLKELGYTEKTDRPGVFLALIGRLKNDLIGMTEFSETIRDDYQARVLTVWRHYQEFLKKSGALDFDDLLVKTVDLLKTSRTIKRILNSKYRKILIDEYQDTNRAQFELTRLMVEDENGLTVVGDAAQAIYSFRGADFRNLSLLKEEYPNLATVELPTNYRSAQTILDAAYGVIANNTGHPVVRLLAARKEDGSVDLIEAIDEQEEAIYVANIAIKRRGAGGQLAVLYRTNSQSRAIEESLIRRGITYKLVGGVRFYDRAEIKDVLSYMRTVINPHDLIAWQRIEGIGKRQKNSFLMWVDINRPRLINEKPVKIMEEILTESLYLSRYDEKVEEDLARIENIKELMAVASESENITDFLEKVALVQSDEEAERKSGEAEVVLMTIHAAKGLEFDEVVIAGVEEGVLPHSRSLFEKKDLEEERRLMYVAMTRAKNKLSLTMTRSRLVYGGRQTTIPSRFLAEIPSGKITSKSAGPVYRPKYEDENSSNLADKKGRRIVPDWEIDRETKDDFADIDAW